MLYREIIAVCSQIHTKHINTLCGQSTERHVMTRWLETPDLHFLGAPGSLGCIDETGNWSSSLPASLCQLQTPHELPQIGAD